MTWGWCTGAAVLLALSACSRAEPQPGPEPTAAAPPRRYADFLEHGFPFVESTVDARMWGDGFPDDNLTPRSLVLALGDDTYAAFDTDLLRLSAAWHGGFLTPNSIAMLSYQEAKKKMGAGQNKLASPVGAPLAATGLYPGWQAGEVSFDDPRPTGPDPRELGRGPLEPDDGRFTAVQLCGDRAVLHYEVAGTTIEESVSAWSFGEGADTPPAIARHLRVGETGEGLTLVAGTDAPGTAVAVVTVSGAPPRVSSDRGHHLVTTRGGEFVVLAFRGTLEEIDQFNRAAASYGQPAFPDTDTPSRQRWPQKLSSEVTVAPWARPGDAYAFDRIGLPSPNPWHRNVRPSGITFAPDGTAVIVTYDGDVYRVSGLAGSEGATWQRIAGGFNEPQSVAVRDGQVYVFSRGGVTRLVDRDGDGESDTYENFCDRFTQSAETRDYAHDMAVAPDGTTYVVKGGQQSAFLSEHSGRVLEISPDGHDVSVFASGLRNAYLGYDAGGNRLFACDQQGHWIPTTPVHVLEQDRFYGFQPAAPAGTSSSKPEPAAAALLFPHRVAQSAVDVVWVPGDHPSPLAGSPVVVDYFRPGLLQVLLPSQGEEPSAGGGSAGFPLDAACPVPLLKGEVNPVDQHPYFVGFQVWGTNAPDLAGFVRLRRTGEPNPAPIAAGAFDEGVYLEFDEPLGEGATDPARYTVATWHYERSASYGSGQFRADGQPGTDPHPVHTVFVNRGKTGVFISTANLTTADQLEVTYQPPGDRTDASTRAVYFSPWDLASFRPGSFGFDAIDFPALFASPPPARDGAAATAASAERGQLLHTTFGCVACHSVDGSTDGKPGPTWKGLAGSVREFSDGTTAVADADYLRESILDPARRTTAGYDTTDTGMPSYAGILSDSDLESILLFIATLEGGE